MREYTPDAAMKIVESVIKDEVDESILTDEECVTLAAKIVAALEGKD